ncbi:YfjI family protein [Chromatium okenii]|uniref:YfjI family protein n=1 Tax=Chromatium okenii TaxID=61644 RepID=UPI0026E9A727|nr:YfjI family protein [Chromatium okenii]MBV5311442.1 DUF3987 domain-containing protein [Chromatium okenii]
MNIELYEPDKVVKGLLLFHPINTFFEIRILEATLDGSYPNIVSGIFNDPQLVPEQLQRISQAKGFFHTLNPLNPECALVQNAMLNQLSYGNGNGSAGSKDILQRKFLMIDIDAERPSKTSATEEQKEKAGNVVKEIHQWLSDEGWSNAIGLDSGNGFHLYYPLDNDSTLDSTPYKALLKGLKDKFTPDPKEQGATIDVVVYDLSRITKIPGTRACKGSDPSLWRMSELLMSPSAVPGGINSMQIEAINQQLSPHVITKEFTTLDQNKEPDLQAIERRKAWIKQYLPELIGTEKHETDGRLVYILDCPFNPEHKKKGHITIFSDGGIDYSCFTNSCANNHWAEFKALYEKTDEPTWKPPQPLSVEKVATFEPELLPDPISQWVMEASANYSTPPDFAMAGIVVALSTVLGTKVAVFPKKKDKWYEYPHLWGVVIANPGSNKSSPVADAVSFIHPLQDQEDVKYKPMEKQYNSNKITHESSLIAAKENHKAAMKKGDLNTAAIEKAKIDLLVTQEPKKPDQKRYIVNDSTIEKTFEICMENPQGVLYYNDELATTLDSFKKPGREDSRTSIIEAWNGKSVNKRIDRISRGSNVIKKLCISLLGTIQPEVYVGYIGSSADGLVQRFQFAVYPNPMSTFNWVDNLISSTLLDEVAKVFNRLDHYKPPLHWYPNDIFGLHFSPEAQITFQEWFVALKNRVLNMSNDEQKVRSFIDHLNKYTSLCPKLALLFQFIVDDRAQMISQTCLLRAIATCEYLESHARKIYGVDQQGQQNVSALALLREIKEHEIDDMTVAELLKKNWKHLNKKSLISNALKKLEELNWLKVVEVGTGGRPAQKIQINPAAYDCSIIEQAVQPARPKLEALREHLLKVSMNSNCNDPELDSEPDSEFLEMLSSTSF